MTYRGNDIGDRPTIPQVNSHISKHKLCISTKEVFDYWDRKGWKTKRGTPVKTLEAAINTLNGIMIGKKSKVNIHKRALIPYGTNHYQNGLNNVFECVSEVNYSRGKTEYSAWTDDSCDNLSSMRPGGSAYVMIFKREYPVLQVGDESAHTPTSLNFLLVLDILRNRGLRYMSDTLHIVRSRPEGRESAL